MLFAQPGDIYFTRGSNLLGKLIRWAERSKDEEKTWANHVGVVTTPGWMVPPETDKPHLFAWVSEAFWHIGHHEWWNRHKENENYSVMVFRPRHMTNEQVEMVVNDALSRTGNRYAWWRIPGFLVEKLSFGKMKVSKLFFMKNRNVCSNHVALAFDEIGIRFEEEPLELDPDDMFDYCAENSNLFQFIGVETVNGS